MLRIGKLTDYALLVVSQMAKEPASVLSAASLAEALHLTTPTVSKVLKMLSESNIVTSTRGAEGGYRLTRFAHEITLSQVISAMEGDLAMTECCERAGLCAIDAMCTLRENWVKINNVIESFLGRLTIADLSTPLSAVMIQEALYDK